MATEFIIRIDPRTGQRYDRHYCGRKEALAAFWVEVKAEHQQAEALHTAVSELAVQCLGHPVEGSTEQLIAAVSAAFPERPSIGVLFFSFASGDRMLLRAKG